MLLVQQGLYHSADQRTWRVAYTVSGTRGIFVVKVFRDQPALSIKWWTGTELRKVASYWAMTRYEGSDTAGELSPITTAAASRLRDFVSMMQSSYLGDIAPSMKPGPRWARPKGG
jgi:hypothetical protein